MLLETFELERIRRRVLKSLQLCCQNASTEYPFEQNRRDRLTSKPRWLLERYIDFCRIPSAITAVEEEGRFADHAHVASPIIGVRWVRGYDRKCVSTTRAHEAIACASDKYRRTLIPSPKGTTQTCSSLRVRSHWVPQRGSSGSSSHLLRRKRSGCSGQHHTPHRKRARTEGGIDTRRMAHWEVEEWGRRIDKDNGTTRLVS